MPYYGQWSSAQLPSSTEFFPPSKQQANEIEMEMFAWVCVSVWNCNRSKLKLAAGNRKQAKEKHTSAGSLTALPPSPSPLFPAFPPRKYVTINNNNDSSNWNRDWERGLLTRYPAIPPPPTFQPRWVDGGGSRQNQWKLSSIQRQWSLLHNYGDNDSRRGRMEAKAIQACQDI